MVYVSDMFLAYIWKMSKAQHFKGLQTFFEKLMNTTYVMIDI